MFTMSGQRLGLTTYYRTISVDNKPTTVIIGPSKAFLFNFSSVSDFLIPFSYSFSYPNSFWLLKTAVALADYRPICLAQAVGLRE